VNTQIYFRKWISLLKTLAFSTLFSFFTNAALAQSTIWSEDFESYADGATIAANNNTANGAVDWSHDGAATVNEVSSENTITGIRSFFHREGKSRWTTEAIDITGYTDVAISLNINELACENGDLILTFYNIDGAGFTEFGNGNGDGDFDNASNSISGLSGASLVITVATASDGTDDAHRFDDILVQGTVLLPIELLSFEANLNGSQVNLKWALASETNNNYFTIERSKREIDWKELTKVNGEGNSSVLLSYAAIDRNPYLGTSYYRLKQTDFDGQFAYSEIRTVNFDRLENYQVNVYPNPATNQITIYLASASHSLRVRYNPKTFYP